MMETIQLIFARNKSFGSRAIRAFTWSRWSHVAIVFDDHVVEASWAHGVRWVPLDSFEANYTEIAIGSLPVNNVGALRAYCYSQVGKHYDWSWIVGFLFRRDWQENSSWVCSELIAAALMHDGSFPFRNHVMNRITPEHLWSVTK